MTRGETAKIVYSVMALYPRFFKDYTDEESVKMVDAWNFVLDEYGYAEVSTGLKVFATNDKNGFPPSPGQVIDCIHKSKQNPLQDMTAAEAWELVYAAITSYNKREAWEKFPDIVKRIIPRPGTIEAMGQMDESSLLIGEKARFIRQYDTLRDREKEYARLPTAVRQRIEAQETKLIEEGA